MFKSISTVSKIIFSATAALGGLTIASAIRDKKKVPKPAEVPAEDTEPKDIEDSEAE